MEIVLGFIILILLAVGAIFGFKFLTSTNKQEAYKQVNSLEKIIDKRSNKNDYRLTIFLFALFISLLFGSLLFDSSYKKIVVQKLYKNIEEEVDSIVPFVLPKFAPPKIEVEPEPIVEKPPETKVPDVVEKEPEEDKPEEEPLDDIPLDDIPLDDIPETKAPPADVQAVDDNIYNFGDITSNPEYVGGSSELSKYLKKNLSKIKPLPKYRFSEKKVEVKVFFVIGKNGAVEEVVIPRKYQLQVSQESIQKIKDSFKQMPKWIPGKELDQPKRVRMAQLIKIN